MPRITQSTTLTQVEHILGSGAGILDFAVAGEDRYYTWDGGEDAEWSIEDVAVVENESEDRFIIYPEKDYFVCEIETHEEDGEQGTVHCWCR